MRRLIEALLKPSDSEPTPLPGGSLRGNERYTGYSTGGSPVFGELRRVRSLEKVLAKIEPTIARGVQRVVQVMRRG